MSGFIRRLYCHAKTIITYKEVSEWIGVDIFVSGPHTNTKLNLNSKTSFGHYNIEFIRKFREKLTPLIEDEQFVFFSGKVFSKAYSKLRHHYVAYLILNEYDELKDDLLRGYREAISQGKLGHRTNTSKSGKYNFYYFPVNDFAPELALSYNFNKAELQQDIYFWLRREMDGSSAEIFSILSDLLAKYDIAFVEESESIKNRRSFYNLTNLLDKQFNHSDLNRLTRGQLRVLRNSILATYGYKFKDYKLNNYFKKNAEKFCRNNKCGIVTTEYSEDHLNDIDMENITLIKSIERNLMKK